MPWRSQSEPSKMEKAAAGLSYFTFGMTGLLYMLLSKGGNQSQLFRFHMYQAVLLSILAMLVNWALRPLLSIGFQIMGAVAPAVVPVAELTIGWINLVLTNTFYLLLLYGAVWAFLGKFAEVPLISNVVRQNMR